MNDLFDIYARSLPVVTAWAEQAFPPAPGESPAAHRRAVKAKALDLLRGLLPAASLSHMGIFASGQTYEQLVLHLLAHPLPEARACGAQILDAVKAVMPSFVARVERPDRGGEWISYLQAREQTARRSVARLGLDRPPEDGDAPSVRLLHVDGDEESPAGRPAVRGGRRLGDRNAGGRRRARRRHPGGDAGRPHRRPGQPPPPPRSRL